MPLMMKRWAASVPSATHHRGWDQNSKREAQNKLAAEQRKLHSLIAARKAGEADTDAVAHAYPAPRDKVTCVQPLVWHALLPTALIG